MDERVQWDRIESIFHGALERESADRAEYLARECAGNEDLRRRVESLLDCDDGTSPIDRPAGGLACGLTLGHYRLVSKLGEGGMGTVYLAQDTLLDRDVAVKVLISEFKNDTERKRRFLLEAKAASALNHPNIVAVYDAGTEGDLDYLVMEYVRGKPLDGLIPRNGLKLKEARRYAIQIADALACTHKSGIIHRDLKPANVLITESGVAKVADFGIAKRVRAEVDGGTLTQQGAIFGTVAYMSPEQAEGKPVDARSDIFSFGSLLYEMVTGRRAFQRDTAAATLAAVLREEPEPASDLTEDVPPQLAQVIEKCLRKSPADRFRSMDDAKASLQAITTASHPIIPPSAKPRAERRLFLWPVGAGLAAIVFGAAALWYTKTSVPEPVLKAVPLTTYPGFESSPSFSPDGEQVVFSWCTEEGTPTWHNEYFHVCNIYIKQIGVEPPSPLTSTKTKDFSPVWSPDGKSIAFLRMPSSSKLSLVLKPQRGGQERVLVEYDLAGSAEMPPGPHLSWTPDSRSLIYPAPDRKEWFLSIIEVESMEKRRLTTPPDKGRGDTAPAITADGGMLSFSRFRDHYRLYKLRLTKHYVPDMDPVELPSAKLPNLGAAWVPDGSGVVFASDWLGENGLWRTSASSDAPPRRLEVAPTFAAEPTISSRGNRLAYAAYKRDVNIWRIDLSPDQRPGTPKPVIASTKPDENPGCSPDGKRLAFSSWRSGAEELWLSGVDGSNPQQLTSLKGTVNYIDGAQWSPDGKSIAVQVGGGLGIVDSNSGVHRRLLVPKRAGQGKWPSWSRDGQWLYFSSYGGSTGIWKIRLEGDVTVQITKGADDDMPQSSFDGKFVYFGRGWPRELSVWRIPVEGGEETKIIDGVSPGGQWSVGPNGIFYFATPDEKGRRDIRFYEFASRKTKKILTIEHSVGLRIVASPDGRSIFYPQNDDQGSDLMLVENFH